MSGIAGAVRRGWEGPKGAARPRSEWVTGLVQRISDAQRHRGPDGSGLWRSSAGEVVFGHRRLAVLDLSDAAAQPMVDASSGCVVTYDGGIYNFREIRSELQALGDTFRSSSDTEVILGAWSRWGFDALRRFRGAFALALWDPRARAVHLVRDPLGIKPLYWTTVRHPEDGEEVVLFASEVRALLASGVVPRRLDPAAVASYLWHGFVIGPETIVEGVRLLPAASVLTVEVDAHDQPPAPHPPRRYWVMPASSDRRTSAADLREELLRTVRMQLVSDVPLGIFLSGGVDSSAVAALASEAGPDELHTFTIGFDVAAYDESGYARQVADALRSRHKTVLLTEQAFQEQLPDAFAAMDQPTFDALNTYFVSRAVREAGMTVALSGLGGDELFGAYATYDDIPRARRLCGWLPSPEGAGFVRRAANGMVALGARAAGGLFWNVLRVAPPQTRWGKVADLACAVPDVLGLYQVSYALFTRETQGVLSSRAVRDAQKRQYLGLPAEVSAEWRRRIEGSELLHAISLLELSSIVGERLLRDTDTAGMAASVEVRVPLLDHVLIETTSGIDAVRRFSPPRKKQLLRDVALGRLDPALFDRPKSGFAMPIDTWARRRLQPQMQQLLADPTLARRAGLRSESIQTLWRSYVAGRPGLYWSRVWAIYALLWWCQTHEASVAS
jgi:asparagine synthase (glutamine-hydrolysing)